MKNGLEQAYEMVLESNKEGTVKTNLKTGEPAMGVLKKTNQGGPEKTGVKKPEEAEQKINPGHGNIKTESKEIFNMLPQSKFDILFKSQIIEEEDLGDESPLEMTGENEFDEDLGDFPETENSEDATGEEVDVATELRLIIDRLKDVAERLGAYDEDTEEISDEEGMDDVEGMGNEEEIATESTTNGKLKPFPNKASKMQGPKSNNKVKSAFNASKKKAKYIGKGGPGKGAADGKLNLARKTTLGPNMSQKAEVKGTMGKPGSGVFDNI